MSDVTASYIRTVWPMLLGHLVVLLVNVAEPLGVSIDSTALSVMVAWAAGALIYQAGRWLERRQSGFARGLGRWVLALGLHTGAPTYLSR